MNKIIRKAKEGSNTSKMTYRKLENYESSDASYKTVDNKVTSVEGQMLFLTSGQKACPIMWKSKKIPRVCDSMKTAETFSADKTTDNAIYFARIIRETEFKHYC